MKESIILYWILAFLVYLIVCCIIYILANKLRSRRAVNQVDKIYEGEFGQKVKNHLYTGKVQNLEEIEYIKKYLKKHNYQKCFHRIYEEYLTQSKDIQGAKDYVKNYEEYHIDIIKGYSKSEEEKAYAAYLLGQYRLDKPEINKFLIECLESSNLYCRVNALRALTHIGSRQAMMKALYLIDQKDIYVNKKVMVDILDDFEGDLQGTDNKINGLFENLGEKMEEIMLIHFTNKKDIQFAPKCYEILQDSTKPKQLKLTAIKYFSKCHYKEVVPLLERLMNEEEWEIKALSAKTLGNYTIYFDKDKLIEYLKDSNWFVRYNTAMTLIECRDLTQIMNKVRQLNDFYALDIMKYAIDRKEGK